MGIQLHHQVFRAKYIHSVCAYSSVFIALANIFLNETYCFYFSGSAYDLIVGSLV